jgi:hypothetical protein
MPKTDVCLNFHVRGSCHSLCPRASSHVHHNTFDATRKAAVSTYVSKVREQKLARG